jgi:hypothetical protein
MNKLVPFIICFLFLGICFGQIPEYGITDEPFLISQLEKGHYAIIYVQEKGDSLEGTKEKALEKAAEVTRHNHYRFFTVESEEQVIVSRSIKRQPLPPVNLYEELIIERRNNENALGASQVSPGWKIIIRCYTVHPPQGAIDSATLLH